MKFINFKKWMEDAGTADVAVAASVSASNSSGGTLKSDVAKVPSKGCVNCSKDFKNWYIKRKKK